MAKSTSKTKSVESVQKTLNSAASLLNRISANVTKKKRPGMELSKSLETRRAKLLEVEIHQAYCIDEEIPLGSPTTDKTLAKNLAWLHEQQTGHDIDVLTSD